MITNSSVTFLRVRGIPIGAHWTWIFVFGLVVWSLGTVVFPSTYPGLDGSTYVVMGMAAALLLFASVLLHELGHAFRALREGMPIDGITLWLFGGVARLRGAPPGPGAEFRVAIFGPVITLVIAVVFTALAIVGNMVDLPAEVQGVASYLARINLIVLGFNLVPALPLDGGRVLRAWLWRRQQSFVAATRSAARAGQAFGATLIAVGVLSLWGDQGLSGIWLAFIGWFLVQSAQAEAMGATMRHALAGRRVGDVMTARPVVVPRDLGLDQFLELARNRRFSTYPVIEDDRLAGVISLKMLAGRGVREGSRRTVGDVMASPEAVTVVAPDEDLSEALSRLGDAAGRAVVVVDDDRIVGMLSRSDVGHAIEVENAKGEPEGPVRKPGVLVWVVVGVIIVVAGASLYHPPYMVIAPGQAVDVSREVTISGVPVDEVNGRYLLTTVNVSRPSALRTVFAFLRDDRQVVPSSKVLPEGVEADEYFHSQRAVFRESRMLAAAAAASAERMPVSVTGTGARVVEVLRDTPAADELRRGDVIVAIDGQEVDDTVMLRSIIQSRPAGSQFPMTVERGGKRTEVSIKSHQLPRLSGGVGVGILVETRDMKVNLPFDVRFGDRNIGGPSAGLAYALAIMDKLSEGDEARGRTIAATGTIDMDGDVGAVGGVEQKALAAKKAGAGLFLVPVQEVEAARRAGIQVRGVKSLNFAQGLLAGAA